MRNIISVMSFEDEDLLMLQVIKISRKLQSTAISTGMETLAAWRKYRKLSLEAAADLIGCSAATYRNWEAARNWPSSYWLPAIAAAMHCTIEDLYFPPPGFPE
jgi:DNA-binding XRE family transcriptional regulator